MTQKRVSLLYYKTAWLVSGLLCAISTTVGLVTMELWVAVIAVAVSATPVSAETVRPLEERGEPGSASAVASASLIFESDFEDMVYMGTPWIYGRRGWWPIWGGSGRDRWPVSVNGGSSRGLQPISYGPTISFDPKNWVINCGGTPCWKAEIVTGIRHDGTTGPIFHQANHQNILWQLPYVIMPGTDVVDEYQRMYVMFPQDLARQMGPKSWRALSEWKTASSLGNHENYDYRIAVYVYTDGSSRPFWTMTGTEHSTGPYYWQQESRTVVPVGRWFKYEWAWHRAHDSSAWTWVKVNGVKIMEQDGGGTTCSGCDPVSGFYNSSAPINRIFLFQMYGAAGPSEQWFDHVELWSGVP